jgi:hypothetical protein
MTCGNPAWATLHIRLSNQEPKNVMRHSIRIGFPAALALVLDVIGIRAEALRKCWRNDLLSIRKHHLNTSSDDL